MSERTKWEMPTVVRASFVFGLIYTFLVGVSSLESGIKVMGQTPKTIKSTL